MSQETCSRQYNKANIKCQLLDAVSDLHTEQDFWAVVCLFFALKSALKPQKTSITLDLRGLLQSLRWKPQVPQISESFRAS